MEGYSLQLKQIEVQKWHKVQSSINLEQINKDNINTYFSKGTNPLRFYIYLNNSNDRSSDLSPVQNLSTVTGVNDIIQKLTTLGFSFLNSIPYVPSDAVTLTTCIDATGDQYIGLSINLTAAHIDPISNTLLAGIEVAGINYLGLYATCTLVFKPEEADVLWRNINIGTIDNPYSLGIVFSNYYIQETGYSDYDTYDLISITNPSLETITVDTDLDYKNIESNSTLNFRIL